MKILFITISIFFLQGCISGPPPLSDSQLKRLEDIQIFEEGDIPESKFIIIETVEAANCEGGNGRMYGSRKIALVDLKKWAVIKQGDAVINVSCSNIPMLNNCWNAKKCMGDIIKWQAGR